MDAIGRRARDAAVLRGAIDTHSFHIDLDARVISRGGVGLELTRREFEVAVLLFRNMAGCCRAASSSTASGDAAMRRTTRTVDMHVSRVRKVLGLSAAIGLRLVAIYGYGYRLERTVPPSS